MAARVESPLALRPSAKLVSNTGKRGRKSARQAAMRPQAKLQPAVIVGGGRVGNALKEMGEGDDVILGRDDPFPDGMEGPIFVCTRNDDMDGVVQKTPESRREDLVFLQNGMLLPWLRERGLEQNTQALVYFAVAKKGEPPTDGKTDMNPEGLTSVWGKWADSFKERLARAELSCHVQGEADFKASMFEKLIWICAFMLVGQKHACTVGEVESNHAEEVSKLVEELMTNVQRFEEVQFQPGTVDRLMAYSRSVAHFPTAVKEFHWRNGYFYNLSQQAVQQGQADPFPTHTTLLKETGVVSS